MLVKHSTSRLLSTKSIIGDNHHYPVALSGRIYLGTHSQARTLSGLGYSLFALRATAKC
jgi:hypothetical protein